MAEFCLECWNRINHTNDKAEKYIFTDYDDLCEGCGQYKQVILMERKSYHRRKFRFILIPLILLGKILTLPYWIYKEFKKS